MSGPLGSSQWMYASGYEIEQSVRFDDNIQQPWVRTPISASNRRTWTWSCWAKRGAQGYEDMFRAYISDNSYDVISFDTDGSIRLYGHPDNTNVHVDTTAVFRDSSAWYHIVVAVDTTQGTDSNRVKIYVNGDLQGLSTTTYPTQNEELNFNNTVEHQLMHNLDAYLSEMHFIDGTALTPASFGETGNLKSIVVLMALTVSIYHLNTTMK